MLSIIIPSYNEEQMIERTAAVINETLDSAKIENELIFIDDGSKDSTWQKICHASKSNNNIRGIHFSRNFGKEAAIIAGLSEAIGECCVVIDCDLQHPPQKILEMYQLWQQGYEIIEGQKSCRGSENIIHTWAAHNFYALISKETGIDMTNASDFKLLDRKAVNALLQMPEHHAFFRALSSWIGFKTAFVQFDVHERVQGKSKWSTKALIKYALNNLSSFSTAPMQLVTILGVIMFTISIIFGSTALFQKISGQAVEGFTTVILILLFSSSIIMISLGIIGYYISRIYEEIKNRPRYIISKTCGAKSASDCKGENSCKTI